jgi:nucleoside-diphosphate-sugar epimerase
LVIATNSASGDFTAAAMKTILIAGATGVIGDAALTHFCASSDWDVIALSRRRPDTWRQGEFRHVAVDLTDYAATRDAVDSLRAVSHVVYTAVSEAPGLISGWHDQQRMQANHAMLANLLDPLCEANTTLRHVTLLQGAKAYGAHAGHVPRLPARERDPRDDHTNFYWLQEDHLRRLAAGHGFAWTIFRPQVVIGAAWGAAMNPLIPLSVYAMLCRERDEPFGYPGGALQLSELADAALLAEAFDWATETPAAHNQTFNITNGDVFAWRDAWPVLADALGVQTGPDRPARMVDVLPPSGPLWARIVRRERLRLLTLEQLLGQSHHYADVLLRAGTETISPPTLLSTIKLRTAGFGACRDSEESIARWVQQLRDRRLIPRR